MTDTNKPLPLQEFRIAPFGYSLIVHGLGIAGLTGALMYINQEANIGLNTLVIGTAAAIVVSETVVGARLIKKQRSLYRRLQEAVAHHVYDERFFAPTTDEWCNRQTARVVCEAAGVLPQYEQLCNERQETATHAYVPHI